MRIAKKRGDHDRHHHRTWKAVLGSSKDSDASMSALAVVTEGATLMKTKILLLDDEVNILRALERVLRRADYDVYSSTDAANALQLLQQHDIKIIISDYRMPGMNGAEFLKLAKKQQPDAVAMILSGYTDFQSVLDVLNNGLAFKFLQKPWLEPQLLQDIQQAMVHQQQQIQERWRTSLLMGSRDAWLEFAEDGALLRYNAAAISLLNSTALELDHARLDTLFMDISPLTLQQHGHDGHWSRTVQSSDGRSFELLHQWSDEHLWLLRLQPTHQFDTVFAQDAVLSAQMLSQSQLLELTQAAIDSCTHTQLVALVYLEVRNFAEIHTQVGYQAADALVATLCEKLDAHQPKNSKLAYLVADQFVLLLPNLTHEVQLFVQVDQWLAALQQPLILAGHAIEPHFNLGYSVAPQDSTDAKMLLHQARQAARSDRAALPDLILRYDSRFQSARRHETLISNALFQALDQLSYQAATKPVSLIGAGVNADANGTDAINAPLYAADNVGLKIVLQPKFRGGNLDCHDAEVLLRWHHAELGTISPAIFIPIAEHDGQIAAINHWVLEQSLQALVSANVVKAGISRLALNISVPILLQADFTPHLLGRLAHYGVLPNQIELELDVNQLQRHAEAATPALKALTQQGVRIAISHINLDYRGFSVLAQFSFHTVKLGQRMIANLEHSLATQYILRQVLRIAHQQRIQVVAEGVETAFQCDFLRQAGCDYLQGFFLARPVTVSQLDSVIRGARSQH